MWSQERNELESESTNDAVIDDAAALHRELEVSNRTGVFPRLALPFAPGHVVAFICIQVHSQGEEVVREQL